MVKAIIPAKKMHPKPTRTPKIIFFRIRNFNFEIWSLNSPEGCSLPCQLLRMIHTIIKLF
jgi:hypothetical protein